MFYKVYSRLPAEFPLTPIDVRQALDSIFERTAATRGWAEVSPQETLLIIALSWGYGKDTELTAYISLQNNNPFLILRLTRPGRLPALFHGNGSEAVSG